MPERLADDSEPGAARGARLFRGGLAVRDLSLHLLDIIENSIRAGASTIVVTVAECPESDILELTVEDDGAGLSVPSEAAADPFYTTKAGKRVGLGLSLLRAAAEQAGGKLTITASKLGGVAVKATMWLSHIDRAPLGDLAATLSSIVCTNPDLDLSCRFCVGSRECVVRASDVINELPFGERCGLAVARRVSERIKAGLAAISATA